MRLNVVLCSAVAALAVGIAPLPLGAQEPVLPLSIAITSRFWELGEEVTVTGGGCADPNTGSSGLSALGVIEGLAGPPTQAFGTPMQAASDGTFVIGPVTIGQPLGTAPGALRVFCYRTVDAAGRAPDVIADELDRGVIPARARSPFLAIKTQAPKLELPSPTAVVGQQITFVVQCDPGPEGLLTFMLQPIDLQLPHPWPDVRLVFNYPGPLTVGDELQGQIPPDQPPGGYKVEATCSDPATLSASYEGFTTLVAEPSSGPSPEADPIDAAARFTG